MILLFGISSSTVPPMLLFGVPGLEHLSYHVGVRMRVIMILAHLTV